MACTSVIGISTYSPSTKPTSESPTICGALSSNIVGVACRVTQIVPGLRVDMNSLGRATGCMVAQPVTVTRMRRDVARRKLLFIIRLSIGVGFDFRFIGLELQDC